MDTKIDKSCLKIKVFELNFINVKKKGSFAIKIQSNKSEFKPVSTKYVNTSLKWEEAFEIEMKNKNFEDEIEITLHQKSFFLSESCLGGVTIPMSILKEDSSRLLKDWVTLNPTMKKKQESGSNTPNTQRYILSTPLAELLICIQLDYTTEELKKYLSTYHQKLQDHISDTMKLLEEEEDNDKLVELRIRDVNSSTNSSIPNILLTKNFPNLGEDKKRKRINGENAVEKESLESDTEHLPTELLKIEDLDDKYDLNKSPKPTSKYPNNNTFELTSSNGDLNLQMNAYQQYFDESKLDEDTISENDTDEDLPSEFESPIFKRKADHYIEDSSDIYKSVLPVETTHDGNILKRSHVNLPKICIEEELSVVQDKKFLFEYLSFNDRFQSAVEKMKSTKMAELGEASDLLINVAEDFLWTAKTYGKIIISEFKLPDHLKTIKPQVDNKGILGGTKYYYKGIFYKLAEADGEIITNIESAAKIAGHELKGCSSYYNTSVAGLSYPLIACIDYRGFRLIAMTVLPINEKTLVVGTHDGGRTIKSDDKVLNKRLEKAGKILNIKPHYVGNHLMYSACDLEGHKAEDGRYYLIDFSRVLPPEFPTKSEEIFFKLLRPEFVSGYHLPLSSDAFSGFKGSDSDENNLDAKIATDDLHKSIKSFAREFGEKIDKEIEGNWDNILTFHQRFPRFIHQAGINMRHLGMMFNHSTTYNCKMLLLIEMSARAIKHILREKMRDLMTKFKYPTEHHYISIVIKYMNQIFTTYEVWEEIMERCVQYFKIDKHDSIKSLKSLSETLIHIKKKRKSRSEIRIPSSKQKEIAKRSSVGITNDIYFVSIEDLIYDPEKLKFQNTMEFLDSISESNSNHQSPMKMSLKKSLVDSNDSYDSPRTEEDDVPLDISHYISCFGGGFSLLFFRICRMMGFHFSSRVTEQFVDSIKTKIMPKFLQMKNCFHRSDLETLGERIKHMNKVAQAQARVFYQKAKQSVTQMDTEYFYQMAIEKLEDALDANPTSKTTLMTYAEILLDIQISTTEKTVFSFESPEIQKINQFYELARKYDPNDPIVLGNYARFLSKCGEYDRARIFYLNSIYLDITRSWPVERYASLLSDLGEKEKAEHFYSIWNKFIVLYKSKNKNSRSGSYMKPSKTKSQIKK